MDEEPAARHQLQNMEESKREITRLWAMEIDNC
jgi:hypothetical protein